MKQSYVLWFAATLSMGFPLAASALDCVPGAIEQRFQHTPNIIVAEMVRYHPGATGKSGENEMKILKILKNEGVLFKPDQPSFRFPEHHGWDMFKYKSGQIVMFFFDKNLDIECNYPLVLK